jgi:hypothetical protein
MINLLGRVVAISVRTMEIINAMRLAVPAIAMETEDAI